MTTTLLAHDPWVRDERAGTWTRPFPDGDRVVRVSVVIPTRNEAFNLPSSMGSLPDGLHEVIVVDGHSTDGSAEVAAGLHARAVVLHQEGKGKGDALRIGFAAVTGDIVVMMDADGSMDGAEIVRFVDALVAGADFVKGSRMMDGGGSTDFTALRDAGNRVLRGVFNRMYRTNFSELCYGYMGFWAHHRDLLQVTCAGFEVETFLNIRAVDAGLAVSEVPSVERCRLFGESNLNVVRDGLRIARLLGRERLAHRPAR
jgi:glycosyltransferase involved in cell wall biosynthesis